MVAFYNIIENLTFVMILLTYSLTWMYPKPDALKVR